MTDFKKVFVDTAPFIYFIEKDGNNPHYYKKVRNFFEYGCNDKYGDCGNQSGGCGESSADKSRI